jgi:hypothetical protein
LVLLSNSCGTTALAAETAQSDDSRILDLTNQMLRASIDLERFYLSYRVRAGKEPRWRRIRYFLAQQTAAGLTLGANIAVVGTTGANLRTPEDVSTPVLRRATRSGFIGVIFQGGSSAFELLSNGLLAVKNKRDKDSPDAARRLVAARLREIDNLGAQRDAIVLSNPSSKTFAIHAAEGKVLKYFRDWCVYEFSDVYADVRSYQSSNSAYYILDVASASVYVASYVLGLKSFKNLKLAGPSAVVGMAGDGLGIISAPASTVAGNWLYAYWAKKLSRQLKEKIYNAEDQAKEEMANLEKLVAGADEDTLQSVPQIKDRLHGYRLWAERYDQYINKRQIELRRLDKVAQQSNVSGPLISGAFLAQDIMGAVNAYSFADNAKKANRIAFASSVPTTVASGASLALSSWWFAGDYLAARRLKRIDALPSDLLQQRLKTLDELDRLMVSPAD